MATIRNATSRKGVGSWVRSTELDGLVWNLMRNEQTIGLCLHFQDRYEIRAIHLYAMTTSFSVNAGIASYGYNMH